MAGLPRSEVSFRRQGSSGSVWDDKFLTELNKMKPEVETTDQQQEAGQEHKQQEDQDDSKKNPKESSSSSTTSAQTVYKTTKVPSPSIDPPSPKVSGCGLCGSFAKSEKKTHKRKTAGNKRKS